MVHNNIKHDIGHMHPENTYHMGEGPKGGFVPRCSLTHKRQQTAESSVWTLDKKPKFQTAWDGPTWGNPFQIHFNLYSLFPALPLCVPILVWATQLISHWWANNFQKLSYLQHLKYPNRLISAINSIWQMRPITSQGLGL